MIAIAAGWTAQRRDDGLVLTRPGGATFRYTERLAPLASPRELVRAAGCPRGFVPRAFGATERLVTDEGEYGALVRVSGQVAGDDVELSFGFVFLDDHYAQLVGMATAAAMAPDELHETTRRLTSGDTHILGAVRRRRFLYQAPAGWRSRDGLFDTTWHHPGYPRHAVWMHVNPAVPDQPRLEERTIEKILGSDLSAAFSAPAPMPVLNRHRLGGRVWHLPAAATKDRLHQQLAVLRDGTWLYLVRLFTAEPASAEDTATFAALVDSIEPLPRRNAASHAAACAAGSHWAD
jgi:hypothetical protein